MAGPRSSGPGAADLFRRTAGAVLVTLTEISESLPNGFHDAEVLALSIDFTAAVAVWDMSIWVGDAASGDERVREEYRSARLLIYGVRLLTFEPPASGYPFSTPGTLTVDLDALDVAATPLHTLPAGCFASRFFVYEWNAFIDVVAADASLEWKSSAAVRRVVATDDLPPRALE